MVGFAGSFNEFVQRFAYGIVQRIAQRKQWCIHRAVTKEGKMKVLEGLYYTNEHEWLKVEGETAYVGITDFAQHALGDIAYIELPEVGAEFAAGDVFGVVESVKAASDLCMPVSGTVTERNDDAEADPALINQDAFATQLITITLKDPAEIGQLLDAAAYRALTEKE
jgi:glycine cleavage system H protein